MFRQSGPRRRRTDRRCRAGLLRSTRRRHPPISTGRCRLIRPRLAHRCSSPRRIRSFDAIITRYGEMAEWLNAAVLKTVRRVSVSRVRIPLSPPFSCCNAIGPGHKPHLNGAAPTPHAASRPHPPRHTTAPTRCPRRPRPNRAISHSRQGCAGVPNKNHRQTARESPLPRHPQGLWAKRIDSVAKNGVEKVFWSSCRTPSHAIGRLNEGPTPFQGANEWSAADVAGRILLFRRRFWPQTPSFFSSASAPGFQQAAQPDK